MTQSVAPSARQPAKIWYHVAMTLVVAAWGLSFVCTRVVLDNGMGPTDIYIYRFLIAYFLLLAVSHSKLLANNWRDEVQFLLCGLCGSSIYYLAENTALEYTLTTNVSLITTISPLFTAMLLGALYKSERPSRGMYMGSAVAILGVAFVIFNSSVVVKMNPLGDMLSLGASLSFAIYSVLLRRLNAFYSVPFISRKTFFYGLVTALPFLLAQSKDGLGIGALAVPQVWGNLLFLGVVCSLMAFAVFAQATKRLGAVTTNNYLYFQPVVTMIASAFLIGEKVTGVGVLGCVMILVGVVLAEKLSKPKV